MGHEIYLSRRVQMVSKNKKGKAIRKLVDEEFPLYSTPTDLSFMAEKTGKHKKLYVDWISESWLDEEDLKEHLEKIEQFCSGPEVVDISWGIT